MKITIPLSLAALVAASLTIEAQRGRPLGVVQGRPPEAAQTPDASPRRERPDAGGRAEHLGEMYAKIRAFDTQGDGKLEEAEVAAVAKAITEGKLERVAHPGRRGDANHQVSAERAAFAASRIAEVYAKVSGFDLNKDGQLDEAERAALRADVEAGKVELPGRPGRGPGRGR